MSAPSGLRARGPRVILAFILAAGAGVARGAEPSVDAQCFPSDGSALLSVERMAPLSAPAVKDWPLAAWTGREIVIWGSGSRIAQRESPAELAKNGWGVAYSPEQNTWRRLPGTGTPPARSGASLVWTGSRLLWWGGYDEQVGATNRGLAYDPETGSAREISRRGAPRARDSHAAVWTGTQMIVWGGATKDGLTCDGAAYDPDRDAWGPIAPMPRELCNKAARSVSVAWDGFRMVVIQDVYPAPPRVAFYNPRSDRWTAGTGAGPAELLDRALAVSPEGAVYVLGSQVDSERAHRPYVFRLNPGTEHWSRVGPACDASGLARVGDAVVVLGNNARCLIEPGNGRCAVLLSAPKPIAVHQGMWVAAGDRLVMWRGEGVVVRRADRRFEPDVVRATGPNVRGSATMTSATYCGGPAPLPGMPLSTTVPLGGTRLLVRGGDHNADSPVVAEVMTDAHGWFDLELPPGMYCLIGEKKRSLAPPAAGAQAADPSFYDQACLAEEARKCDATFKVPPRPAPTVTVGVNFYWPCFGLCYRGPLPP